MRYTLTTLFACSLSALSLLSGCKDQSGSNDCCGGVASMIHPRTKPPVQQPPANSAPVKETPTKQHVANSLTFTPVSSTPTIPQETPRPPKPILAEPLPAPLPPAVIIPLPPPAQAHTPEPPALLTYQMYLDTKSGMSFEEVRKLVGFPGKELSRVDFGDGVTAVFQWEGSRGSHLLVTFQRGRVVSKAQSGLK